ncbi:hydroxyacid dehydrogenase [Candidatus Poribacteria bacterium]|nr:hydroxyacid dehydrogenase [Candidatus Poribacteria bacterium]
MKILVADKFAEDKLASLSALGHEVTYDPEATAETLAEKSVDAEILIVRGTRVPAPVIQAGKKLALIIRAGAGYNTIDVGAASARGIYVTNCPGVNSVAVAELAMGLILAIDRRIPQNAADLRAGKWNKKEYSKADGLLGKTLGIAGMGMIGQALAARAAAFDLKVIAWSRSLTPERAAKLGVGYCPNIEDLCEKSDILSVHMAETADTRRIFNDQLFAIMKPKAIFINTSRGGVVDQAALKRAMREKGIRAGLDVFDPEPEGGTGEFNDEILREENLIGTHHIGASTNQAQAAIADETVRIVREFTLRGEVPNCVNIEHASPAKCQLVVRHYDRVGVLAGVLDILRRANINAEEMSNTVFQGSKAAVAVIRLSEKPSDATLKQIAELKDMVIHAEAKHL